MSKLEYVEIFGVPGVGKTTLYSAIKDLAVADTDRVGSFSSTETAVLQSAKALGVLKLGRFRRVRDRFLLSLPGARQIAIESVISPSKYNERLQRFVARYPDYMRVSRKALADINESRVDGEYYAAVSRFLRQVMIAALLEEAGVKRTVVCDQFLVHSVFRVVPVDSDSEKLCRQYFRTLPEPKAVIVLDTEAAVIVERLRARTKTAIQHTSVGDRELLAWTERARRIVELGTECLRERGVRVIALDAGESAESLAAKSVRFVQGLERNASCE